MNKLFRQSLLVCLVLLLTVQRMPAPFEVVPDDAANSEAAPKRKKKKVAHTARASAERTPKPVQAPTATPAPAADAEEKPAEEASAPPTEAPASAAEPGLLSTTFRKTVQPEENVKVTYILTASSPFNSSATRQEVRFIIITVSQQTIDTRENKRIITNTALRKSSIFSGKTKSLAQLADIIRQSFRRFTSGGVTPEQVLGQIGDARYGGELKFVAEADALRFDYFPKTERVFRLERADVEHFLEVLPQ